MNKPCQVHPLWDLLNVITHDNYCFILLHLHIINLLPKKQKMKFYLKIYQINLLWKSVSRLEFPLNRCFVEQIRWMPLILWYPAGIHNVSDVVRTSLRNLTLFQFLYPTNRTCCHKGVFRCAHLVSYQSFLVWEIYPRSDPGGK